MTVIQSLPQELLELIIDIYSFNGTAPLKMLSLVSRAWRLRSQSHIFREFFLNHSIMKKIYSETPKPTNAIAPQGQFPVVFSYVQNLTIDAQTIASPHEVCLGILQFFSGVVSLKIKNWDFCNFGRNHITNCFSHIHETVGTLELHGCYVNSEVLISLTSEFCVINSLRVLPPYFAHKTYKIQSMDKPQPVKFQGDLFLAEFGAHHEDFLTFVDKNSLGVCSIHVPFCKNKGVLQKLFEDRGDQLLSVGIGFGSREGKVITIQEYIPP